MPTPIDLTVGQIRRTSNLEGSVFFDLYSRLTKAEPLTDNELINILRFAVLFLRSTDDVVSRLGYRVVLQYGEVTGDYEPLHAVAQARELIPVVAAAERLNPELAQSDSLESALFAAHSTNFATFDHGRTVFRTRGQMELRTFNARENDAIVVAPTSYGKSEMLIDKIAQNLNAKICVLVPSRALIAQTRALVINDVRVRESQTRVITHPDAYTDETQFIAVMTQERLHRLLIDNPSVYLDQLLVDEAHNLLDGDNRAIELSQVVLTSRARNRELALTYYTPFMSDPGSLKHVNDADARTRTRSINEHVKAERIVIAEPGGTTRLYDQFLNRTIDLGVSVPSDELSAIRNLMRNRTLVYVNRPKDAQDLAGRLAGRSREVDLSIEAQRAITAIADLIDPNYSLIQAIRAGVLFHHGQVPDVLRQYIEHLFREDSSSDPRVLVTTSTLLEGVNTPADCLIMMTPSRGPKYLTRSAFRNLIGRVARFKEVFDPARTDLDLLQPRIYLVPSSYSRDGWNVDTFLTNTANLAKTVEDEVKNPLLDRAGESEERQKALEYLENIEPGTSQLMNPRVAATKVGRLCFQNGVRDFDIFQNEVRIQARIDDERSRGMILTDVAEVIDAICSFFFENIDLIDSDDLERIRDTRGARRFYARFLGWRAKNEPFKLLVSHFLSYWTQLEEELVYVGSRWGEETYGENGVRKLYVRMRAKTRVELINLAVVKIKEEQDFVDFRIIKYIEIMNSLGMLEQDLYYKIKFGTSDPFLICLLRNGFSPELARLVKEKYSDFVQANLAESSVDVMPELASEMSAQDENDVLVYEASTLSRARVVS
ncbi:DEAD/DEAH box helicase [Pseudoclavibacter sp. 13-3]|uniref:DEAD/DEAH box helicase n=1 Tax=Pseudoclavibacter sp. 13-3 TaxID=2901228 RepID=UPI001E43A408|nr:DEAD/DEAH box helicase [Pseudoclavibacter sp. 13-3]MCD7102072.1 DEAD/DEAH box helicase [Pseudoclavibacter sp. 13-3]